MDHEKIYSALFAKLSASSAFVTASRKLRHWSDVPASEQPAIFVVQRNELVVTTPGLPSVWRLHCDVYLYGNTNGDPVLNPSSILNPLLDATVALIAPNVMTNKQTLGELVQHAWVEGEIVTDEGLLGDQAVCVIPIMMKAV